MLLGSFNWEPISHNNIISKKFPANNSTHITTLGCMAQYMAETIWCHIKAFCRTHINIAITSISIYANLKNSQHKMYLFNFQLHCWWWNLCCYSNPDRKWGEKASGTVTWPMGVPWGRSKSPWRSICTTGKESISSFLSQKHIWIGNWYC